MYRHVWLWAAIAAISVGICKAVQKPMSSLSDRENPLLVAVMGPTGSGKSTFMNRILGRDRFRVGRGLPSQTSIVEDELISIDGRLIRLVDTPGFDDTNMTDTQVLELIVTWMGVQYKQKTKFAGILYLRDITEFRMKGSDVTNLRMFRALCGTTGLENVIIVTTKWNMMAGDMDLAELREDQLKSDYLGPMLNSGAEYARDHGTSESSRAIIRKVLQKDRSFYLDFQREIIDEGKRLNEIEAGKVLQEHLAKAEQNYQEQLEAISEELKNAHSKELQATLEKERQKTEEAMEKARVAQSQLDEEYSKKFEEQEKQFRQMMENLRDEYEERMKQASEEEKVKLRKQQEELDKALKAADKGDSSLMWTVAEKVIRTAAVTYSINAVGAMFGIPPFLLQGIVHGAMHLNINLTAATAKLPGVLGDWARPLANLSDLNLPVSTFSRLGLTVSNISDWGVPLAGLSELATKYASKYAPTAMNLSGWQAQLSGLGSSLANLTDQVPYAAAANLSELVLATLANFSVPEATWSRLAAHYAEFSELGTGLLNMSLADWKMHVANVSGLAAAHLANYTDMAKASFKQINTTVVVEQWHGLRMGVLDMLASFMRLLLGFLIRILQKILDFLTETLGPIPDA